jgi:integrase
MSKGYVIANIRVTDQDRFQEFSGMAGPAIKKYGGKVLARGPDADRLEGDVSGALNKWLQDYVPEGCVIHSFRHSMRDRLRAVQCPSDMIDQIGGWSTAGVGQAYWKSYDLVKLTFTLRRIIMFYN